MIQENEIENDTADREIIITRLINAPRELVFEAWTDSKHLDKWWGPNDFTTTTHEFEFKPGGTWRLTMHHPVYGDFPNTIVFDQIVRPELIVYTNVGAFQSFVTFTERNGKTELVMRGVFNSVAELRESVEKYEAIEGGNQTLERLEAYLAKM
jgi:uncharacterized protein YndB with AHSA1/START domain